MGCISEFGVLVKTLFVWMHAVAAPSGCTFADLYAYVVGSVAVCGYACAHRWWNDVLTVCVSVCGHGYVIGRWRLHLGSGLFVRAFVSVRVCLVFFWFANVLVCGRVCSRAAGCVRVDVLA